MPGGSIEEDGRCFFRLTFTQTRIILLVMETRAWPLHDLTLKALNLSPMAAFYEEFGFRLATRSDGRAVLTAGEATRTPLRQLPNAHPPPPKTASLFHS